MREDISMLKINQTIVFDDIHILLPNSTLRT